MIAVQEWQNSSMLEDAVPKEDAAPSGNGAHRIAIFRPLPLPQPACWHFRKHGTCAKGEACRFSHQEQRAAAPPAPARGCSYYWLHRMPKDESEYALLVDTLEAHGFRRAATPEQVAAAALLWCGTSTIRAPLLPMY